MRIKAKTIKNILLLPFKQDPKAFKEKCTLFWDGVNVARKGPLQHQLFPSILQWGCMQVPGFKTQPALDYQG